MDYRVERLKTPAECEIFALNATARNHPDLALEARRKAIYLKASVHEAQTPIEAEAFVAVYAYEALLTRKNGKKTRATSTWQAIKRYGIIEAVQRAVSQPPAEAGEVALRDLGLEDLGFEALVLRHEASFSAAAVSASRARLAEAA